MRLSLNRRTRETTHVVPVDDLMYFLFLSFWLLYYDPHTYLFFFLFLVSFSWSQLVVTSFLRVYSMMFALYLAFYDIWQEKRNRMKEHEEHWSPCQSRCRPKSCHRSLSVSHLAQSSQWEVTHLLGNLTSSFWLVFQFASDFETLLHHQID